MRSNRGFTMVETLVALVVLAVGMLGVASLFALSLHSGASAISRMQAVNLASDMADRIRANRRAGIAYAGTGVLADNVCVGAGAANCTPQQLAKNDIYLWQQLITQTFPNSAATGTIAYASGGSLEFPSTYTISLSWAEQGQTTNSTYAAVVQAPEN